MILKRFLLTGDQATEKLLLETTLRDGEVNNRGLGGQLGHPMRVGKTRSHVESELIIEIVVLVTQLDELHTSLLCDLLLEKRVKHRVDLVLDVLNKDGLAIHEWELKSISKVRVRESKDESVLLELTLALLDPSNGLSLRINHEWVARRTRHHDTVLDRQVISGETLHVPVTNGLLVNQELGEFEVVGVGNAAGVKVTLEVLASEEVTELSVERTAVRDKGRCLGDITG